MKIMLLFTAVCLGFGGCSKGPQNGTGRVLSKIGTYQMTPSLVISVTESPKGIVHYEMTDDGRRVINSTENPSIHQRWSLYLDDNSSLWFTSSDIGVYVWVQENGKYAQHSLTKGDPLINKMPPAFISALPSSLRRVLGI